MKLKSYPTRVALWTSLILVSIVAMSSQNGFCFWTQRNPQHQQITELIQWPSGNELFIQYSRQMGRGSEKPDEKKDWLFAHGNERKRAGESFNGAVRAYQHYKDGVNREYQLKSAFECLSSAYHYCEDMGDFSEGNERLRNIVTLQLTKINKNSPLTRATIKQVKGEIEPPNETMIYNYLQMIKGAKGEIQDWEGDKVRGKLLEIVACLEQLNTCFLDKVGTKPIVLDPSVAGVWKFTCCNGKYFGEFDLRQQGNKITGKFRDHKNNTQGTLEGQVSGSEVKFKRVWGSYRQDYRLHLDGSSRNMNGTFTGDRDTSVGVDFKAVKVK
jgi:hypothetical protein